MNMYDGEMSVKHGLKTNEKEEKLGENRKSSVSLVSDLWQEKHKDFYSEVR